MIYLRVLLYISSFILICLGVIEFIIMFFGGY